MTGQSSQDPGLERLKVEGELRLRQAELDFEREKWLEEGKRASHFHASPMVLTVAAAVLGLLGTAVGAYLQGRTNSALERQKFESALIGKAFESGDRDQAAKYLTFLAQTGLVTDEVLSRRLMTLAATPESIPVLRPERGVAELSSGVPDKPRHISKLVLSDMQALSTLETIRFLQDTVVSASYHYMLDTSGVAIPVVPEQRIAFHTARHNAQTISIGIAHISRGMTRQMGRSFVPYTSAQIATLQRLVRDIARRYRIQPDSIVAKSQLDPTKYSDAVELLPSLRQAVGPSAKGPN